MRFDAEPTHGVRERERADELRDARRAAPRRFGEVWFAGPRGSGPSVFTSRDWRP